MESGMLKEAMKRRRGKGVDIKLIIDGAPHDVVPSEESRMAHSGLGNDEEPEEEKLMDLAPEVKDDQHPESRSDQMASEEQKYEGMPGEVAADKEEEGHSEPSLDDMLSMHGDLPMHKKMMAMKSKKK